MKLLLDGSDKGTWHNLQTQGRTDKLHDNIDHIKNCNYKGIYKKLGEKTGFHCERKQLYLEHKL